MLVEVTGKQVLKTYNPYTTSMDKIKKDLKNIKLNVWKKYKRLLDKDGVKFYKDNFEIKLIKETDETMGYHPWYKIVLYAKIHYKTTNTSLDFNSDSAMPYLEDFNLIPYEMDVIKRRYVKSEIGKVYF